MKQVFLEIGVIRLYHGDPQAPHQSQADMMRNKWCLDVYQIELLLRQPFVKRQNRTCLQHPIFGVQEDVTRGDPHDVVLRICPRAVVRRDQR